MSEPTSPPPAPAETGGMPPDEFLRHAHAAVDWIAEYLAHPEAYPVLPPVKPGDVAARLPEHPPERGEPMEQVLRDFEQTIVPGLTHWNHPGFLAYFANSSAGPGIIGELLAAAVNVNAMLWRTGPASVELELRTLDWLRQMMGLPEAFHGTIQDTASISTLTALAAAREETGLGIREEGMAGRDLPRLRLYCSEEAHSSVEKAAITLGIGLAGVRRIPTDAAFRMDAQALARAVEEDVAAGWRPFCVVATVGTTSTTSIDPVPAVAEVCERHGLWLHVDAAYGGAAALVPEMRGVLEGCERAHSLVVNPHKWLFTPMDVSCLYCRRPESIRRAFSLVPAYLQTPEGEYAVNLMDYGPALGRRFRSLKLWMTLRCFGAEGMAARIREHVRIARAFAGWVRKAPGWEVMAPAPFSLVLYRHVPREGMDEAALEAHNRRIMDAVNASGIAFLSHTVVRGRFALRMAIGNVATTEEYVFAVWKRLREAAGEAA